MARRAVKPKPVVVTTICSICGEDWPQHQEIDGEVSTLECVRLLKAKIANTPVFSPTVVRPFVYPWWQTTYTIQCGNTTSATGSASFARSPHLRVRKARSATCAVL